MMNIPNYKNIKLIYESTNSFVFRAINQDNQQVILKMLKENYPSPEELTRYQQEYDFMRCLADLDGVIKVYCFEKYQNTQVICLEDFGGESLKYWLTMRSFSLDELLTLAIRISDILEEVHKKHIIHKDINPTNLVWNPVTDVLKMIDFGIATKLSQQQITFKNPNVLEGTLAYISPEQTGRMNRALDYRTDFYSLGATLYELFTGVVPFNATDMMELVHCHIAKQPAPPFELMEMAKEQDLIKGVKKAISAIILKLLEKIAEDRYQSLYGLKADLQECQLALSEGKTLESFTPAQNDISASFQILEKLYGREQEIETLFAAVERVAASSSSNKLGKNGVEEQQRTSVFLKGSQSEIMLVAGDSGIGKSALVKEVYKLLTDKRGYFITGKFDTFQRNIPYSAIVTAFGELVQQLLTEGETQLAQWKEKILTAMGSNGQVIIDVIPKMERIIGQQPALPTLEITESKNRFNLVFQNFIRVFCQPDHPLVIFLDDLQWIDSASLKLLEMVMTDRDTTALFLIGAYRDVEPNHPLIMAFDVLRKENVIINQITLKPLACEEINQLITESLHQKAVDSLKNVVMRKTKGNPFFVNQFLHRLYENNLLHFVSKRGSWEWDLEKIETVNITDNVVDFMICQLKKLPQSAQHVLRLAACMGNYFDLDTLSLIYKKSVSETFNDLMPAMMKGIILSTTQLEIMIKEENSPYTIRHFRFLHHRFQQAAYALVDEVKKKSVHLQIGRLYLQNIPGEALEEQIFHIVGQLNLGFELVEEESLRLKMVQLNLKAGEKAKEATAYAAAKQYFSIGRKILQSQLWEEHYDLTFALYKEEAEVEYLNAHFEQSEALIQEILVHAKSPLEKVEIYRMLVVQYTMKGEYVEAVKIGREGLRYLNIDLPESDFKTAFKKEMAKVNLGNRTIGSLVNQDKVTNREIILAIRLLRTMAIPAYFFDQDIWFLLTMKNVNLSLTYGQIAETPPIFCAYGIILGTISRDYQAAYQFGLVAIEISEKLNRYKCQTKTMMGGFLMPWVKHIKYSIAVTDEGYKAGLESGDLQYVGYLMILQLFNRFYQGENLQNILSEISKGLSFNRKAKNQFPMNLILGFQMFVFNLTGLTESREDFHNEEMSEAQYLEQNQKHQSILCYCFILKSQILYLYGEPARAIQCAIEAEKRFDFIRGVVTLVDSHFYYSLSLLALYNSVSAEKQVEYWNKVEEKQKQMKIWVDHCQENFLHKYQLVAAEIARISDKDSEAVYLYTQAIASAKKNGFVQDEALANELVAQFWLAKGFEQYANIHLREAHYAYQQWGAVAKIADLEEKYPLLSSTPVSTSTVLRTQNMLSTQTTSSYLDLNSMVKASNALLGEIVLSRLLKKMMQIVIENAGAEKGFLLLPQQDKWFIEAEGHVNNTDVTVLQSIALEKSEQVSANIIHYVAHTQENVVLHDATESSHHFSHDPYLVKFCPKSLLCAPLINQGELTGILYLENNLMTGAFTQERLEVLNLLSSQIALSIKNSLLYNNLEEKVAERTRELAQEIVVRKSAEKTAKVANKAKSAFLANMSHELRTPLNAILGFAQIMTRSKKLDHENQENIGIISRSGEHLLTLINQVLDLTKIEAERITLNEIQFDLYRLLDDLEDMFNLKADDKHLQLIFEHEPSVPQYLLGDEVKLRQVLINLLNNALKFTKEGGVIVRVKEAVSEEGKPISQLHFEVEDTGPGIASNELDQLFEAFVQTSTGKQTSEGTGLGLTISRQFVQLMGGEMIVKSEVGRGTTFEFSLQCQLAEASDIKKTTSKKQVIALVQNQPRYRILVVDDKWPSRQLLIKLLSPLGFEIQAAENGQEAIEIWEKWQPHLIWMDMRMPVMDGYEATQRIKAQLSGQATAIIALTASALEEERAIVLDAGCDDMLRKPFRESNIFEVMHKHLGVRYIYEEEIAEPENEEEIKIPNLAAQMAKLPEFLFAPLQNAIECADLQAMKPLIEQISENEKPLAKTLNKLAKNFRFDILQEVLEEMV
ncbi:MAG: AAA family ATPase [Thiomargarita sp.]|nr:AAA family ATPase [Thiomargarita sp.]